MGDHACLAGVARMSRLRDLKSLNELGLSSLAGGRATRHLISGSDGGFGAGIGQDTLGLSEALIRICPFRFHSNNNLSLMKSIQIMLADSFAISIGQDETAQPAGDGAAAHHNWNRG